MGTLFVLLISVVGLGKDAQRPVFTAL
jgi:hypothetical protein